MNVRFLLKGAESTIFVNLKAKIYTKYTEWRLRPVGREYHPTDNLPTKNRFDILDRTRLSPHLRRLVLI